MKSIINKAKRSKFQKVNKNLINNKTRDNLKISNNKALKNLVHTVEEAKHINKYTMSKITLISHQMLLH